MIVVPPTDDTLGCLSGQSVDSTMVDGVQYRVARVLGAGGMSIAFLAVRATAAGASPVVMKVMRPHIMRQSKRAATLIVTKEAVALGRLNERIPPTPFVVRLVDTGEIAVSYRNQPLDLPYIVLEYVHGGAEGTTLTERIDYCVRRTGSAFDPERASHAIECLAQGLDAIHEVHVIHRDLTPANILCCGFGPDEIFKIADFGIARPIGAADVTFGSTPVGTPGYAAPEQILLDNDAIGPASDVFSLAALVYKMLTGRDYFDVKSPLDTVNMSRAAGRKSITETPLLHPEIGEQIEMIEAVDAALARATHHDPAQRPQSGSEFAAALLAPLRPERGRLRPVTLNLRNLTADPIRTESRGNYLFTTRQAPGGGRIVQSVAWDGDGRCLAVMTDGFAFWNGTSWSEVPTGDVPFASGVRFAKRMSAGQWLIGGDNSRLGVFSAKGLTSVIEGPSHDVTLTKATGTLADLAVVVGESPSGVPLLYAVAGRHWFKPLELTAVQTLTSIARVSKSEWLICGRSAQGQGYAAVYRPLEWAVQPLSVPESRAYLACAASRALERGIVVGAGGRAVTYAEGAISSAVVDSRPDLSAAAIDMAGQMWAGSVGALWLRESLDQPWGPAWLDAAWRVPFVSMYADVGLILAMTVDGGIIEGRLEETR